jgi:hypothetical protein
MEREGSEGAKKGARERRSDGNSERGFERWSMGGSEGGREGWRKGLEREKKGEGKEGVGGMGRGERREGGRGRGERGVWNLFKCNVAVAVAVDGAEVRRRVIAAAAVDVGSLLRLLVEGECLPLHIAYIYDALMNVWQLSRICCSCQYAPHAQHALLSCWMQHGSQSISSHEFAG